jgi:hypothetical protein
LGLPSGFLCFLYPFTAFLGTLSSFIHRQLLPSYNVAGLR